jgi:NAD(P)-dependent dehydrogenase (short-subunit alcohol dehydrogenase family)
MAQALAGKSVLITGAASGIGAELARQLHARGARLGLLDLRAEPLHALAAELPGAEAAAADVRDRAGLQAAIDDLAGRLGGLDVAVANAGIATGGPVHLIGPDAFEATIEVNLLGVWRTARAAFPHLIARRGYLLLTSSAAALSPTPYLAAYSASKAGVEAFGRAARIELAHHGVDVGVAYFLFLDTPMVSGGESQPAFQALKVRMPGPIGRTYPLAPAVEAMADGIERRARMVAYPRFLHALFRLRGLLDSRLADLPVKRSLPRAEAAFIQEAARIGADAAARLPQDRAEAAG